MYIIAEIGGSHQGDFYKAQELIYAVKESGAQCAKFQAIFADEIVHPKVGTVPLPTGDVSIYQSFKALERGADFYAALKAETEKVGLDFLCTPFGSKSLALLEQLNVKQYKVASPELNHVPLLQAIANNARPVFLSLGVSRLRDIEQALDIMRPTCPHITLLHCITSYPAKEEEYNLRLLPHLKALFNVAVGISDHSLDPILVPALSVFMGSTVVEKHICLSRKGQGLDDPIALEPGDFARMVQAVYQAEQQGQNYLRELNKQYGQDRIQAVLGDGIKKLAPGEMSNYGRSNRSICAVHDIIVGEILTKENTALYRVEKHLRPGLLPDLWPAILGRKAAQRIPAGEGLRWVDIA